MPSRYSGQIQKELVWRYDKGQDPNKCHSLPQAVAESETQRGGIESTREKRNQDRWRTHAYAGRAWPRKSEKTRSTGGRLAAEPQNHRTRSKNNPPHKIPTSGTTCPPPALGPPKTKINKRPSRSSSASHVLKQLLVFLR